MKKTLNLALKTFYQMLRVRLVEEKIAKKYTDREIRCPMHLSIGQEAIAVGVCSQLSKKDYVLSNHRAHAHYLAKGGSLNRFIAEIYGKSTGCCFGKGGSMIISDKESGFIASSAIVGGTIPVAVGVALAAQMKNEKSLTVIFFGDGATEEGVFSESLNFAALKNLPILFVCENNFYSVYSSLSVRQSKKRSILAIAKANGIDGDKTNGNDIEKVYSLSKNAIDYIKSKNKPFFLEFETYRFRAHCGPKIDHNLGYRSLSEIEKWENQCPIEKQYENLMKKNELSKTLYEEMVNEIENEINKAFSFAKNSVF